MNSRAPHGARGLKRLINDPRRGSDASRPAWGAWIETHSRDLGLPRHPCRAPHGARGLKHPSILFVISVIPSRPAWGAWIETCYLPRAAAPRGGRAPHGARGLKLYVRRLCAPVSLVAPRMGRVD